MPAAAEAGQIRTGRRGRPPGEHPFILHWDRDARRTPLPPDPNGQQRRLGGTLGLALFVLWISRKPGSSQHTYGYRRAEILAALANGATLLAIAVLITAEAVERFVDPPQVSAPGMMAVAAGGLLVNLLGLWILHGGRDDNLNLRGAWLHVLTDTLGSLQVLIAGGLIYLYGWQLADPVASVVIALLVVWSGWHLLRETVRVLLEQAPGDIDVDRVHTAIAAVDGVEGVHDLHVWTIGSGLESLSAHVVANGRDQGPLLDDIKTTVRDAFGIDHVTIQVEAEGLECESC